MSGGEVAYRCDNCGECCKRLLIDRQGVRKGLPLLPEERNLFSGDLVKPGFGVGPDPEADDFKVFSYQLTVNECPHRVKGGCGVWVFRPAICRAYPVVPVITQGGAVVKVYDLACSAISSLSGAHPEERIHLEPSSIRGEVKSCSRVAEITRRALEEPGSTWFYDLKTGKWIHFTEMLEAD